MKGDRKTARLYHVKTLADLWRVLRYSSKMAFHGYDREVRDDDTIVQSHLELAPIHHYRLFRFLRNYTVWDAWLAGGEGAQLLRDVRKAVRADLQHIQLFQPDGAPRKRIKAQPGPAIEKRAGGFLSAEP